jgi:hypothetical protein
MVAAGTELARLRHWSRGRGLAVKTSQDGRKTVAFIVHVLLTDVMFVATVGQASETSGIHCPSKSHRRIEGPNGIRSESQDDTHNVPGTASDDELEFR